MVTLLGSIVLMVALLGPPPTRIGYKHADGRVTLDGDVYGEMRLKSTANHAGARCLRETPDQPWRCGTLMDYGVKIGGVTFGDPRI